MLGIYAWLLHTNEVHPRAVTLVAIHLHQHGYSLGGYVRRQRPGTEKKTALKVDTSGICFGILCDISK